MKNLQFPKPLKQEEETRILTLIKTGNKAQKENAKQTLIEHNIRLVIYIAHRYKGQYYELDDLVSIGTIGLIKATHTFDHEKNIKFATYASRCIQNEMLMHLRKTKKTQQEISMEEALTQDSEGNKLNLFDLIGTNRHEIEQEIQDNDTLSLIKDLLNELEPEEKDILCYRFGIDRIKKKQKDIAELFNISQSYVSRIEKRAINKIKQLYKKREQLLVG